VEAPADADEALAKALKAFGHGKRLSLLRFVTSPRSLEEIAGHLLVARQSAKEHLEQLVDLGLVEARAGRGGRGPVTRYVAAVPRLFDVYDRLGARIGLMTSGFDQDVRGSLPTTILAPPASKQRPPEIPRLIIVHGLRIGQTIPFHGEGPWLMGRDPNAALCIDYDPYVSHRHAEVRRGAAGFEVVDGLSSNGTWVDWEPVPRGGVATIENGSLLRLGRTLVLFRMK
jgi:DNA-binding transcriptional ArsR family regulator